MSQYRYWFAILIFSFPFNLFAQMETNQISLNQLMQFMAKHKEIHATFVESKYIKGIDVPLESSGDLMFMAPSTMVRHTLQPKPEMLKLTGDTMTVERMGKTHSLHINDYPEISLHFEGVRALLAGDAERLNYLYHVDLTGTFLDWKLVLRPLQQDSALKSLNLLGSHDRVNSVEVHLNDGDYSIMQVSRKNTVDD